MNKSLPIILFAVLMIGCYDSRFGEADDDISPEATTATIGYLRDVYAGTTFKIASDVIVGGVVTTSDFAGNFYRTLCIEEEGAALEIMAGLDHLHNDFPVGCHVTLRLKGLALGESYGVLQVGHLSVAGSGFVTDYLKSKAELDAVLIRTGGALKPLTPNTLSLSELTPWLCGTLVRIEGLQYSPEDMAPSTWAGYKRFTDAEGREIYTYTRNYASFAGRDVPATSCTLTGILQRTPSNNRYILKLRDERDCNF